MVRLAAEQRRPEAEIEFGDDLRARDRLARLLERLACFGDAPDLIAGRQHRRIVEPVGTMPLDQNAVGHVPQRDFLHVQRPVERR